MTTYLRDHADNELSLDNLNAAKHYFNHTDDIINRIDWLGTNEEFEEYQRTFEEYIACISNAASLEELADILNEYEPRLFDAGHQYYISTVE